MQNNLSQHSQKVAHTIQLNGYKKVVFQISKINLKESFKFTTEIRQKVNDPNLQIYTLYDSLKKQCCTDIIGARHVPYDALFHFGYACFSEQYKSNHYYMFPQYPWPNLNQHIKLIKQQVKQNNINLIICDQSIYRRIKQFQQQICINQQVKCSVASLPVDKKDKDTYFGFSYYYNKQNICDQKINVLVIKPTLQSNEQTQNQLNCNNSQILQNLYLCRKSLCINKMFTFSHDNGFMSFEPNLNKKIMQRLSQISQLQKHSIFGILVSNPSTVFCQNSIKRCRNILQAKGLKHFTFMMNNLNECKLGNFPEIQVYIVISCYNYSLYSIKDFYRLVVTPQDLEIAFQGINYQSYNFDLSSTSNNKEQIDHIQQKEIMMQQKQQKIIKNNEQTTSLSKVNNQLAIQEIIQTLDYYRERQYKGLDFSQKKQIQSIKKGKIGIAEQYRPLKEENSQTQK